MRSTIACRLLSTNAPFLTERAIFSPFQNSDCGMRIKQL
jgi:hypothetical protein